MATYLLQKQPTNNINRDEEAKAQMEVTFHGPLRLIQASLPGFRKRKTGSIVNITSIAGIDGLPSCGLYAASKFALEGEVSTKLTTLELLLTAATRTFRVIGQRIGTIQYSSSHSRARCFTNKLLVRIQDHREVERRELLDGDDHDGSL